MVESVQSEIVEKPEPRKYGWFSLILIGLVSLSNWGTGHLFIGSWRVGLPLLILQISVIPLLHLIGLSGIFEKSVGLFFFWLLLASALVCAVSIAVISILAVRKAGVWAKPRWMRWCLLSGAVIFLPLAQYALVLIIPFHFENFNIPSESNRPTLTVGDYLMSNNKAYEIEPPKLGEMAVFLGPLSGEIHYVKRVIAGPGQTVQLQDGVVYVDGVMLRQEVIGDYEITHGDGTTIMAKKLREYQPDGRFYEILDLRTDGQYDNTRLFSIPEDYYFVLGDNRDNSIDSRMPQARGVGYVPRENFVARPLMIYWAKDFSRLGPLLPQALDGE